MQSVDKNDVDIKKLFVWKKSYDILDSMGKEKLTVWFRVVGDADLNKARASALRKSAQVRKEFKDENSPTYLTYFPDFSDFTKEDLIKLVMAASTTPITRLALQEVVTPYPIEPSSESDLEAQENFQKEVDEWGNKRSTDLQTFITDEFTKLEENLKLQSEEYLIKEYKRLIVAEVCENEMIKEFRELCVFYSCYKDEELTERLFDTFEDFSNLPEFYKKQFVELYREMEISTDDLKK